MFNPQRRAKVADIFMQQKIYQLHLEKMRGIEKSQSPQNKRYEQQQEQERYLRRIQKSKREVKDRLSQNIKRENIRLLSKLVENDNRPENNPESSSSLKKRFHSYFNSKKEAERIHHENYTMVTRMDRQNSGVPTLSELKKQYKKSRKLAKNCRKLPSISKYEAEYKKRFSQSCLQQHSRLSSHRSKQERNNRNQGNNQAFL